MKSWPSGAAGKPFTGNPHARSFVPKTGLFYSGQYEALYRQGYSARSRRDQTVQAQAFALIEQPPRCEIIRQQCAEAGSDGDQ